MRTGYSKSEKMDPWVSKSEGKGTKSEPRDTKSEPKGSQREPKVSQREPKVSQREPKVSQKDAKGNQREPKWKKIDQKCDHKKVQYSNFTILQDFGHQNGVQSASSEVV